MKSNKLSGLLLTAFIAAAVMIGITAFVSVRAVKELGGYYGECSEGSAARAAVISAARDNILGAERDILAAISSDTASANEYIEAAKSELDALEDGFLNVGEDVWGDAEPLRELIAASQVRDALFGSVSGGNMKIARNVFFSEYQPKLSEAAEYTAALLADLSAEDGNIPEQLSARASKYTRICVGMGLLGISAVTFIALYIDKKLRENIVEETQEDEAVPEDKYELLSPEKEEDERLSEAEETISNAVNCINILADGDPDAAADGEYPYRYENVLSAIRKMKARLRFIIAQINRAAEFVSAESARVSDNAEELSAAAEEQEATAERLADSFGEIRSLISQSGISSANIRSLGTESGRFMEDCTGELKNAENALDMLEKSAEEMDGLAKAAADIASRANVLAVNAAMNAAKGECSGRSLAELADEARGLALSSADASSQAAEIVKRCGERIDTGTAAVAAASLSASEAFRQAQDMTVGAEALEKLCEKQSEALRTAEECMDKISGFVLLSKNASEEYAASGRMLSEQSGALKKIVPGHSGEKL